MKTAKILMLSLSIATLTGCHVVMPAKPLGSDYAYAPSHYPAPANTPEAEVTTEAENTVAERGSLQEPATETQSAPDNVVRQPAQAVPVHYPYPYMQRDVFSYALEAAVTVGQLCIMRGTCWRI